MISFEILLYVNETYTPWFSFHELIVYNSILSCFTVWEIQ